MPDCVGGPRATLELAFEPILGNVLFPIIEIDCIVPLGEVVVQQIESQILLALPDISDGSLNDDIEAGPDLAQLEGVGGAVGGAVGRSRSLGNRIL